MDELLTSENLTSLNPSSKIVVYNQLLLAPDLNLSTKLIKFINNDLRLPSLPALHVLAKACQFSNAASFSHSASDDDLTLITSDLLQLLKDSPIKSGGLGYEISILCCSILSNMPTCVIGYHFVRVTEVLTSIQQHLSDHSFESFAQGSVVLTTNTNNSINKNSIVKVDYDYQCVLTLHILVIRILKTLLYCCDPSNNPAIRISALVLQTFQLIFKQADWISSEFSIELFSGLQTNAPPQMRYMQYIVNSQPHTTNSTDSTGGSGSSKGFSLTILLEEALNLFERHISIDSPYMEAVQKYIIVHHTGVFQSIK